MSDIVTALPACFRETPWDAAALGIPTHEVTELSHAAMKAVLAVPGHYTIRVDPMSSKQLLHDYGFYYCDTIIEISASPDCAVLPTSERCRLGQDVTLTDLLDLCRASFAHDHFHRDFKIAPALADLRYERWLTQMYEQGGVHGYFHDDRLVGFIAIMDNRMQLQAIACEMRGQGLVKYFLGDVGRLMFARGHAEILGAISASNLAVMNAFAGLGFHFNQARDVYHRLVL